MEWSLEGLAKPKGTKSCFYMHTCFRNYEDAVKAKRKRRKNQILCEVFAEKVLLLL